MEDIYDALYEKGVGNINKKEFNQFVKEHKFNSVAKFD